MNKNSASIKNQINHSDLRAGGDIYIGDIIYQTTLPQSAELPHKYETIKRQLSFSKFEVLVQSHTINTNEEVFILELLTKIKENEAKILINFYQEILKMPWRKTIELNELLETGISKYLAGQQELGFLKSTNSLTTSVAQKLRKNIPFIPLIITSVDSVNDSILTLWDKSKQKNILTA